MAVPLTAFAAKGFPAPYYDLLIANNDLTFDRELPSPSTGKAWLATRRSNGAKLVVKTVCDSLGLSNIYPAYCSLVSSLISARFYFLAPVVGFTANPPLVVAYPSYADLKSLRTALPALPATSRALIAGFVCYSLSYLEGGQLVHGCLHSGNIFLTDDRVPIITDCGLARTYHYFDDLRRNDQISWIAPELLLAGRANYAVDTYSYGVLLFELFEGRRPFAGRSNTDYLTTLRNGELRGLDFAKTPADWRAVIQQCTDQRPEQRPSFAEMYQGLRECRLVWPGSDVEAVRAILGQYPLELISRKEAPPWPTFDTCDSAAILANSGHGLFEECVQYCVLKLPVDAVSTFCGALSMHVRRGQANQQLVRFALSAVTALCRRGDDFRERALKSPFFGTLQVTTLDQADILLECFLPALLTDRRLLCPTVFRSIALLFVFHPNEMLNLVSAFAPQVDTNFARFMLSLWPLFVESVYGARYLRIVAEIRRVLGDIVAKDVLGILARFQASRANACPAFAFIAETTPTQLMLNEQDELNVAASWPLARTVFLRVATLSVSQELAARLIRGAVGSGDARSWAPLVKYARMSDRHSYAILMEGGWYDSSDVGRSFTLLVAMFVNAELRPHVTRAPEYFETLKATIRPEQPIVHAVCSLMQRAGIDENYVLQVSQAGLLGTFLHATLEAQDPMIIKFGIVCIDVYSRGGYAEEWLYAVGIIIRLMKTNYQLFGDDAIAVMATLSKYKECFAILAEQGLCDYYRNLQKYDKYADYARFFLASAARFSS
jgi:hypothetical protein